MTGTMIPYRNISVKTAIQMVTNMKVLEDRNNKRYGGEDGQRYLDDTMDKPRHLVRVTPTKMTTWSVGWHARYE